MADSEASPVAAPPRAPSPAASAAGAGAAALRGRSYAVVEAAAVAPAPHQAPPPARTTALRGHLAWVADVVLLAYCAASWVNLAAIGVAIAARRVCGDDSRAAAAAKKAAETAFIVMAMLIPVASPRFVWIVERCRKVEDRQRQVFGFSTPPFMPICPQFNVPFLSLGLTNCVGVDAGPSSSGVEPPGGPMCSEIVLQAVDLEHAPVRTPALPLPVWLCWSPSSVPLSCWWVS